MNQRQPKSGVHSCPLYHNNSSFWRRSPPYILFFRGTFKIDKHDCSLPPLWPHYHVSAAILCSHDIDKAVAQRYLSFLAHKCLAPALHVKDRPIDLVSISGERGNVLMRNDDQCFSHASLNTVAHACAVLCCAMLCCFRLCCMLDVR